MYRTILIDSDMKI